MQTGRGAEMEDIHSTQLNDQNEETEHGKKSLIGKVKDKAKKLKSKIKSSGNEGEDKGSGHISSEEDEDDNAPYSPEVSSQQQHPSGTGAAPKSDQVEKDYGNRRDELNTSDSYGTHSNKKFDLQEDPVAPAPGSDKTESQYDRGLRAAADRPPSESDTAQRQHNVPAAGGYPSAGIAGGLNIRDPQDRTSGELPPALPEGSPEIPNKVDESEGSFGRSDDDKFSKSQPGLDSTGFSSGQNKDFEPSEDLQASDGAHETTYGDRASGALTSAKDTAVNAATAGAGAVKSAVYPSDETGGVKNSEKPSQSWTDLAYSAKDAVVSNLGLNSASSPSAENQARTEGEAHLDPTKGSTDPTAASPSITDKFKGTVQSLTDSLSSTLRLNSPSATPVDPDQKGVTQKIWDSAASAKDAVASSLGYASPSPNQKENVVTGGNEGTTNMDTSAPVADQSAGVVQRGIAQAKDGAVSAKDYAVSYFHPGQEDEDLSDRITQLLSPSQAKEGTDPSGDGGAGVVSRVTGAVSSMFGSKATTDTDTAHSKGNSGGDEKQSFSNLPTPAEETKIH